VDGNTGHAFGGVRSVPAPRLFVPQPRQNRPQLAFPAPPEPFPGAENKPATEPSVR